MQLTYSFIKIQGRKNRSFPPQKTKDEKEFYGIYGIWGTQKQVKDYIKWRHRERAIDKSEKGV